MPAESTRDLKADCCVAGGGPAGLFAGFLLARAGVDVIVLEKHADFLRDFRGDTIHPSTLQILDELGLLEEAMKIPHGVARRLEMKFASQTLILADFEGVKAKCPYIVFMPQWDLLNFIAERARRLPNFRLMMKTPATGLSQRDGRIIGVEASSDAGSLKIHCDLVIAADGRHSTLRPAAGLAPRELGAPMDVLWFKLSRQPGDPEDPEFRLGAGQMLIQLNRGDHWQCGFVIRKGGFESVKADGIDAFRTAISDLEPRLSSRVGEIADFSQVSLLSVAVDRLEAWSRPGFLAIGDAAHAMSPIGGVGINLAIQDAVAAANILWRPLKEGRVSGQDLASVQKRRQWPVRITQAFQVAVQKRLVDPMLEGKVGRQGPPLLVRLAAGSPLLRPILAHFIGFGARPEHVESPG